MDRGSEFVLHGADGAFDFGDMILLGACIETDGWE
jgi:hypothetical protein